MGLEDGELAGVSSVSVTTGASVPEVLIDGLIQALCARFDCFIEEVAPMRENVSFKLPRVLTGDAPQADAAQPATPATPRAKTPAT